MQHKGMGNPEMAEKHSRQHSRDLLQYQAGKMLTGNRQLQLLSTVLTAKSRSLQRQRLVQLLAEAQGDLSLRSGSLSQRQM